MAINNQGRFEEWLPALFDGQFDWDFLLPAFKETRIEPMDFDAVVERRGHFLIFETKGGMFPIKKGQSITLTQQWRSGATILHISGKRPADVNGYAIYREGAYREENSKPLQMVGDNDLNPGDAFDVVFHVRRWFCWASGWPVPTRETWDNELWQWDHDRADAKQSELTDKQQLPKIRSTNTRR